jgi:hypothetical protein
MKRLLLIAAILVSFQSFSQTDSTALILREGTVIPVKLLQNLNGKTANEGDVVEFEVTEDIRVNNTVVVPKGSKATGTVTDAEKSKILGKKGKLAVSVDYIATSSGKNIKVRSNASKEGSSRGGRVAAGAVLVSPLILLVKGSQAKYDAGTIFKVYVDDEYQF